MENSSILKQILYMEINLENFYSWNSIKWRVSGYAEVAAKWRLATQ